MAIAGRTDAATPVVRRFAWTAHAETRARQREINQKEVERMIERHHRERAINRGRAQWRVSGEASRGARIAVIYDHPHGSDPGAARIVSAWPL